MAAVGLDLALAGLVFLGGIALFATGLMGGGDVKLMAAASIWFGTAGTVEFLISTVLAGGALACFFLMRRGARRMAGGHVGKFGGFASLWCRYSLWRRIGDVANLVISWCLNARRWLSSARHP